MNCHSITQSIYSKSFLVKTTQ